MGRTRLIQTRVELVAIPGDSREQFLVQPGPAVRCMDDHRILQAGISSLTPGYRVERAPSYFNLLLYCHGGGARVTVEGKNLRMRPGEVMLIPTGGTYSYRPAGSRWDIAWAHLIDCPAWNRLFGSGFLLRKAQWGDRVRDIMRGYLEESRARHPDTGHALRLHVELLVSYLKRELGAASTDDRPAREKLQALWSRIHRNLRHRWTVREITALAGLGKTSLFRICGEIHGTTPMEMVATMRMELAADLLSSTQYTLAAIADETGYTDAFAFSKAFKRHAGFSPREYRRRRRSTGRL